MERNPSDNISIGHLYRYGERWHSEDAEHASGAPKSVPQDWVTQYCAYDTLRAQCIILVFIASSVCHRECLMRRKRSISIIHIQQSHADCYDRHTKDIAKCTALSCSIKGVKRGNAPWMRLEHSLSYQRSTWIVSQKIISFKENYRIQVEKLTKPISQPSAPGDNSTRPIEEVVEFVTSGWRLDKAAR